MKPKRPTNVPLYSDICLSALNQQGLSSKISLGGTFGPMHYLEYRLTYDIDAWWQPSATGEEQRQVIALLENTLHPHGEVRVRTWGDVVSIELKAENRKVFTFQIAHRSAQLEPSIPSPWYDIPLDSLPDLVANKMTALVERGAPRDFLDIYHLCQAGLFTPEQCWQLWRQRQQLAESDTSAVRANMALATHLARIEQHRPLAAIVDPAAKESAQSLRTWFKTEFTNVLTRLD
ncbi:MAG: nucleotidyl transferase AbiEii/AbiGii toxin family protein [Anaerolineae bacterium]|nr:nucleotidyl transferase AbiEii/AbiGii toxin family protein [Anaerolineae bacterium]